VYAHQPIRVRKVCAFFFPCGQVINAVDSRCRIILSFITDVTLQAPSLLWNALFTTSPIALRSMSATTQLHTAHSTDDENAINMAAVHQPYNIPPAMPALNRRQSIESCCDLYADVERSVHHKRSTNSRSASPKRDLVSKVNKPLARQAKSALFLYPQDSLEDGEHAPVARWDDVSRKASTNSESTTATKLLAYDFEYEVSAELVPQKLVVRPSRGSQQKSVGSRASSKEQSVRSQKQGAKSSVSLKESKKEEKTPESTKRAKSREQMMQGSGSGRSQGSITSKSRSRSSSKPRTNSDERSSGTRSSSKSRSQSQHQRTSSADGPPKKEIRSLSPKRTDLGNNKPPNSSQQPSRQCPPGARKGPKMVWSPDQGYMSRSTPNIGSAERSSHSQSTPNIGSAERSSHSRSTPNIGSAERSSHSRSTSNIGSAERSSHSSHPRLSGRSSQTESRRTLEKSSSKKEKKDKDRKKEKQKPLTTRGWRAQMAERFGRTPVTAAGITKASSYRASTLSRIPSTLFCKDDFAERVQDDLSVIP
jgi:hypothetical protein